VLQCAYDDTIDDDIDEGAGVCMCASIVAVLLQCIAGGALCCCSVLWCVAVLCGVDTEIKFVVTWTKEWVYACAIVCCCSVLCSVLQCIAVCVAVCVAVYIR